MVTPLIKLTEGLEVMSVSGPLDRQITAVTYDSRRVRGGELMVAIKGTTADGHDYIGQAMERGATAVVAERPIMPTPRVTQLAVADSREALAVIAANYHGHPADHLKMVGITGTNGKTTTSFMVREILRSAGLPTGLLGTVQYEIGERIIAAGRTTPESLDTQEMLACMVSSGCRACVMEVTSHALALKRVHGIDFDVAVFTNLTQDHLDFHGTMENYFRAKSRLFKSLEKSSKRGRAVINIDDPWGEVLTASIGGVLHDNNGDVFCVGVECLTYGLSSRAMIRAEQIEMSINGCKFTAVTPRGRAKIALPLIGQHNVYNALAAIGAALALDIELPVIARALKHTPAVPGRLEKISTRQPFSVYVDYAHTEDALRNVILALKQLPHARLITVFGCGGNRDTSKRPKMGAVASRLADYTIITSDNPRKEDPHAIIAQIKEGFNGRDNYEVIVDRRTAIWRAVSLARKNDIVLIAGKGHETYQEFSNTVVPFDDRLVARECLNERKQWIRCN